MRFFNTAGPVVPEDHYCIPPLERFDLRRVLELIRQKKYFVLHAPRQTGKTSALLALRDELKRRGFRVVYLNVEIGQSAREDVGAAMRAMLSQLALNAELDADDPFVAGIWLKVLEGAGPHAALQQVLTRWAAAFSAPLVLLVDEVDSLVGDALLAVLRQLRAGYPDRPGRFPQSVILCGIRDVRDYRIHSRSGKAIITGGSAFNIKAESLRLGDFTAAETEALLTQHTEQTGQPWTDAAKREVFRLSQGQPWLVNALAYRACQAHPGARTIPVEAVHDAREELIVRRETHLDQLTDKLGEGRVRRVIGPLLSGDPDLADTIPVDDLQYVKDLGLVRTDGHIRIANPIYQEVVPRDLTWTTQLSLPHEPPSYQQDGALLVDKLLAAFQTFFREHSEHWVERFAYREAGPQLLLQAFLQRIVNAGGRIEREYGLGRRRTDLLVVWPANGDVTKIVIECKLLRGSLDRTIREGLEQTRDYMDRADAPEGHLVIFDRTEGRTWEERIFRRADAAGDRPVTIWGM